MIADKPAVVAAALGELRKEMARRTHLIDENKFAFTWALTDAAISVLQARAAMRSAFYSVTVNLSSITDQQFIEMMEQAMLELDKRAEVIEQEVLNFYEHR